MKILYVTDLDGTLMRTDKTLSDYTVNTINRLISQGMNFTYATARSIQSAMEITGGLKLNLPVITRNGTVLADNATGKMIKRAVFTKEEIQKLKSELPELWTTGFVSSYFGDEMRKIYLASKYFNSKDYNNKDFPNGESRSLGLQKYIEDHEGDKRMIGVESQDEMFEGEPGYVTLIDDKEKLEDAYNRMKQYEGWECVFQKDSYGDEYWLEICPDNSTKAKAILKLKESIGADKLVVFGDSVNDLPMFEIADESFAMGNALDAVKISATGILGTNDEDSVVKYLESTMKKY